MDYDENKENDITKSFEEELDEIFPEVSSEQIDELLSEIDNKRNISDDDFVI